MSASDVPYAPKMPSKLAVAITLAALVGIPLLLLGVVLVATPLVKPEVLDAALRSWLGVAQPSGWARDVAYAAGLAVVGLIMMTYGALFSGVVSWWERRIAGRMQNRIGPNRAGFLGFFVWVCDAVKLLLKEDLCPADADALLFRAAPYFVMVGFGLTFVALPFGHSLIVADLNVGVFYITSVTALVVVGILVSGWSSNSKWALFGGMRSAAQVISYEIPAGVAVFVPILMAGTLSMQGIIRAQGGLPWEWFIFRNPAALIAFFVFFTSQLAEANRTPFDLPEAESELVAGYFTEYSGFRWGLYVLAEYGNIWVLSALSTTLFLGGWQIPGISAQHIDGLRGTGVLPAPEWWGLNAASMLVFALKTAALANVVVWLRWTLPRIRVDQMMSLAWKYLVPIAFACFVFTLFWQLAVGSAPKLELVTGLALTAAFCVVVVLFLARVRTNIRTVHGDRVDLSNW